jgi:hypothetical protein
LVSAIISLALGAILMGSDAMQLAMDAFIVYMAIAWLITLGILRITHALRIRKMRNNTRDFQMDTTYGRSWWIALIFGILLIVFMETLSSPILAIMWFILLSAEMIALLSWVTFSLIDTSSPPLPLISTFRFSS